MTQTQVLQLIYWLQSESVTDQPVAICEFADTGRGAVALDTIPVGVVYNQNLLTTSASESDRPDPPSFVCHSRGCETICHWLPT